MYAGNKTKQQTEMHLVVFHREAIYSIMAHASMTWSWFDRSTLLSDPEN
jgi:hypothetical protein